MAILRNYPLTCLELALVPEGVLAPARGVAVVRVVAPREDGATAAARARQADLVEVGAEDEGAGGEEEGDVVRQVLTTGARIQ